MPGRGGIGGETVDDKVNLADESSALFRRRWYYFYVRVNQLILAMVVVDDDADISMYEKDRKARSSPYPFE